MHFEIVKCFIQLLARHVLILFDFCDVLTADGSICRVSVNYR